MMADSMDIDVGSRGTKRKAEEDRSHPMPKRIKALEQDVVNKIAAGEIIVSPMNALKELIENSVDAGATAIEVVVKDGGLKLLQITDNGHGINKDDLPILAERFTTSKLKLFEDLSTIATYGFRGEALASISYTSHLTVTTKTAESSCAWRAHYQDGRLVAPKPGQSADPKPIAGRLGTQITVEDLFYNAPQRKRAYKSPSEEYAKIIDVVGRYAIHRVGVAFSCKKHGDSANSISISTNSGVVDRIKQIYSAQLGNELIHFEASDEGLGFKATGWATNANYSVKKTTSLLFINHRLVESSTVKTAISRSYSNFLPKGGHPWVYISLEVDPKNVDVNVHPTKQEVRFLNEDEIVHCVCDSITAELSKVDVSRAFVTQSLMPGTKIPSANVTVSRSSGVSLSNKPYTNNSTKPNENNMVRTDPSTRKITSMLSQSEQNGSLRSLMHAEYNYVDRTYSTVRLSSVKELRAQIRDSVHNQLTEIFATHTFVGIVDISRRLAAIQSGVNLCLVDYGMICKEFFYQIGLTDFGSFGTITFETPLDLRAIIKIAAEAEQDVSGQDLSSAPDKIMTLLIEKKDMLHEYFSMDISEDGRLHTLPLLLKGYLPALGKLPRFLLRLGPCVEWRTEKECLDTFLRELARFYEPEQIPNARNPTDNLETLGDEEVEAISTDKAEDVEMVQRREQLYHMIEHVLFPAFKAHLVGTIELKSAVRQMTDLKSLYRVFERC